MRATSVLRRILDLKAVVVVGISFEGGGVVLDVKPTWRQHRCSRCGRRFWGRHDLQPVRLWRHLDFGGVRVSLRYQRCRVDCRHCGVVVEAVPWASDPQSRFTDEFEEQVAYLAAMNDKTTVTKLMRIDWRTVGRIVERVIKRLEPQDRLEGLELIGIDEFSFRKRHKYVTIVCDHVRRRVVWAAKGQTKATAKRFFRKLGKKRCRRIRAVTMDMSGPYIGAVREAVPHAQIVFDHFHVVQLVNNALDKTRRQEWQKLRRKRSCTDEEASTLKGYRWPLLKRPWNLTGSEKAKLKQLQQDNRRLFRAYLLKEQFAAVMTEPDPDEMSDQLRAWEKSAKRSRLSEFVRVAKTISRRHDDIVAYARLGRLNNGLAEGLNNKARLAMRRAYGFHSAEATIAMIMLCCSGIQLRPIVKVLAE